MTKPAISNPTEMASATAARFILLFSVTLPGSSKIKSALGFPETWDLYRSLPSFSIGQYPNTALP